MLSILQAIAYLYAALHNKTIPPDILNKVDAALNELRNYAKRNK